MPVLESCLQMGNTPWSGMSRCRWCIGVFLRSVVWRYYQWSQCQPVPLEFCCLRTVHWMYRQSIVPRYGSCQKIPSTIVPWHILLAESGLRCRPHTKGWHGYDNVCWLRSWHLDSIIWTTGYDCQIECRMAAYWLNPDLRQITFGCGCGDFRFACVLPKLYLQTVHLWCDQIITGLLAVISDGGHEHTGHCAAWGRHHFGHSGGDFLNQKDQGSLLE